MKNNTTDLEILMTEKYGAVGSKKRNEFREEALDFYASQVLLHQRKEAKLTQIELAEKTGLDKSYISRIETGNVQPTMATFLKIINAMGKSIEIV